MKTSGCFVHNKLLSDGLCVLKLHLQDGVACTRFRTKKSVKVFKTVANKLKKTNNLVNNR